ncbi:hypothetical protein A3H89_04605 [Candidatus Amesbacteria bacterium RIFCSPLOWO2_02_FULL_48_11]|uniref:Uncharacterized protein n=3 Tax=Candidatus Amesiibacteriota TaxID=1752730 RepID=A0A1F4Z7J8_9BACT|nr:MAG: hypothetical protein UY22_C0044G0003 [Candidatus Amesbacteria bacterium GW2011_GWC1_48_10]KKW00906.1 MAG: hypothetical protein UY33_C0003G0034 [Candidatus Amesbacteria bacterium GW2011_GWA1_48_9]OGC97275.1 MAG: hypothetical protein A3C34_04520 [Candidatus Amesbacteria bacterium RIFCSPHIGHO2_02_FULL_48_21]OGC99252.1 MAG: hypothetical protein A2W16_02540 [Candidatus Amesbacteria bacterium RBG_16_48_31]OGD00353.1 MAG: hypothetical protein A2702_00690 [Candidatus Amesbacteria bacterium RIFC
MNHDRFTTTIPSNPPITVEITNLEKAKYYKESLEHRQTYHPGEIAFNIKVESVALIVSGLTALVPLFNRDIAFCCWPLATIFCVPLGLKILVDTIKLKQIKNDPWAGGPDPITADVMRPLALNGLSLIEPYIDPLISKKPTKR